MALTESAELTELGQGTGNEALSAEAGVHAHQQHHVHVLDDALEQADGCCGVEHHAGFHAALLKVADRAVEMRGGLPVHSDDVRAGIGEPIGHMVGVGHHHVDVHRDVAHALDGLQHVHAKGEVTGEVTVHDVEVNEVGVGYAVQIALKVGHIG